MKFDAPRDTKKSPTPPLAKKKFPRSLGEFGPQRQVLDPSPNPSTLALHEQHSIFKMASPDQNMPFIRNLASSDRKLRTQALTSLQNFLSSRRSTNALGPVEILKLWKGLYYALWMCDRAIPQQNLCNDLAGLMHQLPRESVIPWLRGFWATMAREWASIDVLRMEKFLLLVRRVLGASFSWMKREQEGDNGGKKRKKTPSAEGRWHQDRVDDVLALLQEWPFSTAEEIEAREALVAKGEHRDLVPPTVAAGLRIHTLDIWVDEAEKVGLVDAEDDQEAPKILERINALVEALHKETETTSVKVRANEALKDDRLPWNKGMVDADADDQDGGGSWDGFDD
ncbi:hypothetical protein MCOR25_001723 [Pyricularia grisea]|uniref:Ribosomal RNA-processing protein 1 n=1 Tax=Pyricularia grisea TaxID=148305 RepID=A0A6P8AU19_PYRGI|nr:uncharacterized protein PgNI_09617 [Pyricularia grisea]KAI6380296.1 hypothetical protein MCOR25_001723 [Pyricularia grisea]TLD05603.1 hypothetical protein PgNI_09617 [Pyricularia grisea]